MNGGRRIERAPWAWVLLAAVVAGALFVGTVDGGGPRTPEERARALAESVKCPTCAGQSVADSDASAARVIRSEIARRVSEGQTNEEIRAALAAGYGDDLLLTPPRSGVAGLVWFLPVAAVVAAVGGLALAFRGWRDRAPPEVSEADRDLVSAHLHDR